MPCPVEWFLLLVSEDLPCVSAVIPPPGSLLLVGLSRAQGITTTILEPTEDPVWGGRRVVAVLTHIGMGSSSTGGHWRAYVREGEVWWKVDSLPVGREVSVQENPFLGQRHHKIMMLSFM